MKTFRYFLINAFFAYMIYLGFYEGVVGAKYVAYALSWLIIVVGFCAPALPVKECLEIAKKQPPIPRTFNLIFDFVVATMLILLGAWITGLLYGISSMIMDSFTEKCKNLLKAEVDKEKMGQEVKF